MHGSIRYIVFSVVMLIAGTALAVAAEPVVTARIYPDTVYIGDRFMLEVTVEKDVVQVVLFPDGGGGMLAEGIEIVSVSEVDTLSIKDRSMVLRRQYELVTFNAGQYDFGNFPVLYLDKNTNVELNSADSLMLVVQMPEFDETLEDIHDIKSPEETPLLFLEIAGYLFFAIMLAWLLTGLVVLIRHLLTKHKSPKDKEMALPVIPPHIVAIGKLEKLYFRKLWQNGNYKQYYTELTDILREYLDGRYGITAMEMTSDEIITAAVALGLDDKKFTAIESLLKTSDLVKFAKYAPDADDNERYYDKVYYFVEDTKYVPVEEAEEVATEESPAEDMNDNKKSGRDEKA